ncbi:hypothetical protein AWM75_06295 [Aerococcus urinaehominis]|uniref:Uncharacterized protein n=1 Tax=Aerococcus urinaehominis TaxID=128944 RepID=A0A0X8FLQ5_9LACT|nr:DUF2273 domain-containing protein [Aerococcus urinaehominis]AMB99615.1 hypothetical protein AWM75_06295 [Aerococcus urinaehominis]SDL87513.1 Small integral membrane protein [Aerococcus urinaehominis]
MKQPPKKWYPYRHRILCLLLAFLFALIWLNLGFFASVFVFLISAVGYFIGAYVDGELDLEEWFNLFNR